MTDMYPTISPRKSSTLSAATPPFLASLYDILNKEDSSVIGWCDGGKSFGVYDFEAMEKHILPTYFRHSKFASFQRQLNYFGFRKLQKSPGTDQNNNIYCQPLFTRDDPSRMLLIKRKTYRLKNSRQNSPRESSVGSPMIYRNNLTSTWSNGNEMNWAMTNTMYNTPQASTETSFVSLMNCTTPSKMELAPFDESLLSIDLAMIQCNDLDKPAGSNSFQPIPFNPNEFEAWHIADEDLALLSTIAMPLVTV